MKTYSSLKYKRTQPSVIALGCFDGIHVGHVKVIETAINIARKSECEAVVFTFEDSPKNFFSQGSAPSLTDKKEKKELISALGADVLICTPFNEAIARMSPEDFFEDIIKSSLLASHIVCGFNYTFGARGAGNVDLLQKLCKENGMGLTVLDPVLINECPVSSSQIRQHILDGHPDMAALALGRPYSLKAKVIDGQHLARNLGFPTVNQEFPKRKPLPRFGVYATEITVGRRNKKYFGITNVGVRPTVGGDTVYAETHIFDLNENLYGKMLQIEFLHFIRDEKKFNTLDDLKKQVHMDIEDSVNYFKTRK